MVSPVTHHPRPEAFMRKALRLAARGFGRTSPNPMVGAVVVRDGEVVGEGYHVYARKEHAEIVALKRAGRHARGADLYVTLEPCAHFGRTPPCTETIGDAGIRRVYVAIEDPNPLVQGKGIRGLRQHGIEVEVGLCEPEAARLNAAFFHFVRHRRPFVTLKLAMTLDGKIATRTGESKWITGEKARRLVHRFRYGADAILVGIGTILRDDPSLDVRWFRRNRINKVVLDSTLRCPRDAHLFASGDPVHLFHRSGLSESASAPFEGQAHLMSVGRREEGLDWKEVLDTLGRRNIVDLLVEGGARIATSLLAARLVNRVALFYGPLLVGSDGLSAAGEFGIDHLSDALQIQEVQVRHLGDDVLVSGILAGSG